MNCMVPGTVAPRVSKALKWTGANGAVRIAALLHGMRRKKQGYSMVTMCTGTGEAGIFKAL